MFNPKPSKYLLLVSGGPDSVYLFHYFLKLKKEQGISFDVIHFNHHLRGKESDLDEHFVEVLCQENSVFLHTKHLHFESKVGLQAQARQFRIAHCFLLQLSHHYTHAVTAHHRDDVLETLVMRKLRGSGLRGLSGIREKQMLRNPYDHNRSLILMRPMLHLSKETILGFLKDHSLEYREDLSNLEKNYFRNQVRHDFIAFWSSEMEKKMVLDLSKALQTVDDYFDLRLQFLLKSYPSFVSSPIWQSWPEELCFRFFKTRVKNLGFQEEVQNKHFDDLQKDQTKFSLGPANIFKDAAGCYFFSDDELQRIQNLNFEIGSSGSYYVSALGFPIHLFENTFAGKTINFESLSQKSLFLDRDKIEWPLFVTVPKIGDRFLAFGKKTPIQLKDFFNSHHIPTHQRKFWPILRDSHGEIVAVFNLEIGDLFRVRAQTKTFLRLW